MYFLLNKVKSFGWVKTLGLVLGAIALAMAAGQAANRTAAGKRKEQQAEELLNTGISKHLQQGKKLMNAAHKDKDKAVHARKKMEQQLEKLGEANEDMDSIADRFNSRRLRKHSDDNST